MKVEEFEPNMPSGTEIVIQTIEKPNSVSCGRII